MASTGDDSHSLPLAHEGQAQTSRQLRSELWNREKREKILKYLLRLKETTDLLVAIGDPVSIQDHIDTIVANLIMHELKLGVTGSAWLYQTVL